MHRLVFLLLSAILVAAAQDSVREEKLRSALIDAFQNIKKASAKGVDDGGLNADLIGSIASPNSSRDKTTTEDTFDLFADDEGLSFGDAFGDVEEEKKSPTTEKSHNVQHIVKTTAKIEKTTSNPSKDIWSKLSDSIRTTVNESKNVKAPTNLNVTNFSGIESMLRVFDADILVQQWQELKTAVSGACREDLQEYVQGLVDKKLWALKSK